MHIFHSCGAVAWNTTGRFNQTKMRGRGNFSSEKMFFLTNLKYFPFSVTFIYFFPFEIKALSSAESVFPLLISATNKN